MPGAIFILLYAERTSTERSYANTKYKQRTVCRTVLLTAQILSVRILLFTLLYSSFLSSLIIGIFGPFNSPFLSSLKSIQFLLCIFLNYYQGSFFSSIINLLYVHLFSSSHMKHFDCTIRPYQSSLVLELFVLLIACILFKGTVTKSALIFQLSKHQLILKIEERKYHLVFYCKRQEI